MNAESEKVREALSDQLSDLNESLGGTAGDASMLADLQALIGRLLSGGAAERDIRGLLQERFDRGELRRETFQLVKSVLDRYSSEDVATAPVNVDLGRVLRGASEDTERIDDEFTSTTVITQGLQEASADMRVQTGSVLRDRFLLKDRVSGGSMGVVYRAVDREREKTGGGAAHVAIKVLSPQLSTSDAAIRALQQEAAKGRCLIHPNIVRFIDLDKDDDLYFIVMEWMEGRTLADILDSPETRTIDVDRALAIVRQVGRALDYAHRCGIVHADVKPGNVMILPDGTAKLFDFGVARVRQTTLRDEFDPGELGAITPAYSSMQVLRGDEPVPADDVFSLGCLMYRLIAGYRVFGPRNAAEAAQEGMKPQRLQSLSDTQWAALSQALALSREERFQSMEEFVDALSDDAVLRATREMRLVDADEKGGGKGWIVIAALLLLGGAGAYQAGLLDRPAEMTTSVTEPDVAPTRDEVPEAAAGTETPPRVSAASDDGETVGTSDPASRVIPDEPEAVAEIPAVPVIDFSQLPPADFRLVLGDGSSPPPSTLVTLREDSASVTLDLVRSDPASGAVTLKVEEVRHSGNRSPWVGGQYTISDDGTITIPPGQDRARISLAMSSDPLREADQQSTLRVRLAEVARSELGIIEVLLEDDDQRAFEAGLPSNTVAFAVGQVSISERDPAVQVDILRFNPDDRPLTVAYRLQDITASEGADYFSAGDNQVTFAPRQRSARVLVPLVQDSSVEGDEAFAVELDTEATEMSPGVYRRLVVIVRDDEIAGP